MRVLQRLYAARWTRRQPLMRWWPSLPGPGSGRRRRRDELLEVNRGYNFHFFTGQERIDFLCCQKLNRRNREEAHRKVCAILSVFCQCTTARLVLAHRHNFSASLSSLQTLNVFPSPPRPGLFRNLQPRSSSSCVRKRQEHQRSAEMVSPCVVRTISSCAR